MVYRKGLFAVVGAAIALYVGLATSGGDPSEGNNNDLYCESEDQCPPGMVCAGNVCLVPGDGVLL